MSVKDSILVAGVMLLKEKGIAALTQPQVAKAAGVTHLADGVGMLAEQAAEAFAWWRGVRPDTHDVIQKLTVPLV